MQKEWIYTNWEKWNQVHPIWIDRILRSREINRSEFLKHFKHLTKILKYLIRCKGKNNMKIA